MFAVLKTGGKQYKVQAGDVLRVEKLAAIAGEKIQFNDILFVGGDSPVFGAPFVAGAAVQAEVIDTIKADKVITYHKRRRKHSSQRTRGHRQTLSLIRITDVLGTGGDKSGVKAAVGARSATDAVAVEKTSTRAPTKAARKKAVAKAAAQPEVAVTAAPEKAAAPKKAAPKKAKAAAESKE